MSGERFNLNQIYDHCGGNMEQLHIFLLGQMKNRTSCSNLYSSMLQQDQFDRRKLHAFEGEIDVKQEEILFVLKIPILMTLMMIFLTLRR